MALAGTASIFRLASRRAAGNGASLSRMFSHSARRQFPVGKSNLNPRDEVVVRTWWQDLFYYSILVPKGKIWLVIPYRFHLYTCNLVAEENSNPL